MRQEEKKAEVVAEYLKGGVKEDGVRRDVIKDGFSRR